MSGLQQHWNHDQCQNCNYSRAFHDRTRIYPDDTPSGRYHYEYGDCPTGRGVYSV